MDAITAWMQQNGVKLEIILGSVIMLALAAAAIVYINRLLRHVLVKLQPRTHLPYSSVLFIIRLISVFMWISVVLLILNFWGISVSGLWTMFVSVAAVIGVGFLAVWTMISNITAGLFITIWRPFELGETVEMLPEGLKGRVIDRNMMFTIMREEKGTALYVPNNFFFQKMFRTNEGEQHLYESFARPEVLDNRPL